MGFFKIGITPADFNAVSTRTHAVINNRALVRWISVKEIKSNSDGGTAEQLAGSLLLTEEQIERKREIEF